MIMEGVDKSDKLVTMSIIIDLPHTFFYLVTPKGDCRKLYECCFPELYVLVYGDLSYVHEILFLVSRTSGLNMVPQAKSQHYQAPR